MHPLRLQLRDLLKFNNFLPYLPRRLGPIFIQQYLSFPMPDRLLWGRRFVLCLPFELSDLLWPHCNILLLLRVDQPRVREDVSGCGGRDLQHHLLNQLSVRHFGEHQPSPPVQPLRYSLYSMLG